MPTMEYGSDHLKVRWFSEIPRCAFQCLYPPALECGCTYADFNCICLAIPDLAKDAEIEACLNSCPVNPDQLWAPSRILDFCDLVGETIQLPDYMNQYARLHRRNPQDGGASYTDFDGTEYSMESGYYSDYSTADIESGYYSAYSTAYHTTPVPSVPGGQYTSLVTTTVSSSSPTSTTSGSAPTATATGPTSSGLSTPTVLPTPSGLSTGAKAGIGVAVPVVAILFGLFIFWFLRKQRLNRKNAAPETDHSSNIPELSEQNWPKKPLPPSESLPAEADSNALHEPDSNFVFESKSLAAGMQSPAVYELSGNTAIKDHPSAAVSSAPTHSDSLDKQTYSSVGRGISQEAVISTASTPISEPNNTGYLNASLGALVDNGTASQKPQENSREDTGRLPTNLGDADAPLSQLEAEMALIAEEKERLQQLKSLAEREAELRRQIMARRTG